MNDLPPFLRDIDLKANFRTYYFNRTKQDDTKNEALAFGGWLGSGGVDLVGLVQDQRTMAIEEHTAAPAANMMRAPVRSESSHPA
jgi:hypothetical protein